VGSKISVALKASVSPTPRLIASLTPSNFSRKKSFLVIPLPELNAYHLGELLYLLALSVAYEGELADVDAFNQPGVESYKRIMGPKLEALKAAKK